MGFKQPINTMNDQTNKHDDDQGKQYTEKAGAGETFIG